MEPLTEATLELTARAAHEINRAYCRSLGGSSQPLWEDAPKWQKESKYAGVMAVWRDNHITPQQLHKSWMRHKAKDGWDYGEEKDVVAKTHPCMVPYDELAIDQRAKDYLFGITVRALLGIELPEMVWAK